MSTNNLKDNFCSSPWIHMRIINSGDYEYCRWAQAPRTHNIADTEPMEYFQNVMQPLRDSFTQGQTLPGCHTCCSMEKHNKVSGRQKQLLKVGVRLEEFEKTLASSPWASTFTETKCNQLPQDWQIDLGNFCNSACIFCSPESSSRLATEWKKIGFVDSVPEGNWSDNPALVKKFIDTLTQSPNIQYLHFIGGETLITPAFRVILESLIDAGLNKTAVIGFTTNLTVWDNSIVELLTQFSSVHLGFSIESFSDVNDYVRWPAKISTVSENLNKWKTIANASDWLMQLRTTPTCLTVGKLLSIYEFGLENNIIVESCNFLYQPELLKPSVLPIMHRHAIIDQMQSWIDNHTIESETIVNIRNPSTVQSQLVQDLQSYVNYLTSEPDESHRLPELVTWLKRIEANRGNSVLTYLPEYEELFRSAGY